MHLTIEEWPPLSSVTGVTSFSSQRSVLSPPLHGTSTLLHRMTRYACSIDLFMIEV